MSSVIIVVIVGMWAALLVPMWLRRHEEADQLGSIDRFNAAMRILSRSERGAGERALVMPARSAVTRQVSRSTASRTSTPLTGSRARLLARRRRVLQVLAAAAVLSLVLAVGGMLSFWWQAVVDLALVAYVTHLRAEAVRAAEIRGLRARGGQARAAEAAEPVAAPLPPARAAHDAAEVFAQPGMDPGWEPAPVPLPTYVNAPVAPRPAVRILDDDLGLEVFTREDEVEEIVTRRRAVNE